MFARSGARPEAGPSPGVRPAPIVSAPALAAPYFMVSQRQPVGPWRGTVSRRAAQLRAILRVPEGKVLISAGPVEVKIELTEELIRSPGTPLSEG